MITLDSELGYALAKAGKVLEEAERSVNFELDRVSANPGAEFCAELKKHLDESRRAWNDAAVKVTQELIAQGMHKMDGL